MKFLYNVFVSVSLCFALAFILDFFQRRTK